MRIHPSPSRRVVTLLTLVPSLVLVSSVITLAQTQPTLIYKTSLGTALRGSFPVVSSVDPAGNTYLAGTKKNNQGPECADVFVQKVDASGANIIYRLTVNPCNFVRALASDTNGYAYVLLFDSSITRISPDGAEIINAWASISGATDIVVSSANNLFVAGALNGDAYAAKLSLASANVVWFKPFGGSALDAANGLAVDPGENVFLTGRTESVDFPAISAAQNTLQGSSDAFVVKIDPSGSSLIYSTYIGGANFDEGSKLAIDDMGNCYVTGGTNSPNFPTVNALQPNLNGSADPFNSTADAFLTKIRADGSSFLYSTFLGGSGSEQARGITVDSLHNAYVTGTTSSFDFPLFRATQATFQGNWQAFLSKLNSSGSALVYSTYESGSPNNFYQGYGLHADSLDNIYLTIQTHSFQGGGDNDGAELSKFAANRAPVANAGFDQLVDATGPTTSVTLDGSASSDAESDPLTYMWKNGAGDVVGTAAEVDLSLTPGQYTFDLTITDTSGAKSTDSVTLTVRDVPRITITSPTETTYLVDESVMAGYSCSSPGGSAVVTCTGNVPNGTVVSTSTAGAKTFTVTATNALGNSANSSVNYAVTYKIFLMYNSGSAFNSKAKPQIRIQLQNANSLNRSASTLAVTALRVTPRSVPTVTVKVLSGNFIFDPNQNFQGAAAGGGYRYDLDASGLSTGNYDLVFSVAGDPVLHVAPFAIK
jgi:hypothetical protein